MKDESFGVISFSLGLILGVGVMFLSDKSDLLLQDKTIAKLEAEASIKPLITVDALGICKVTQGGKTYMLIDVTNETKALDAAKQTIKEK